MAGGGGAGLMGVLTYVVQSLKTRADARDDQERQTAVEKEAKAEAEWKAELKHDVKTVLQAVTELGKQHAVHGEQIASVRAQVQAVDTRSEEQAKAHRADREADREARALLSRRLDELFHDVQELRRRKGGR